MPPKHRRWASPLKGRTEPLNPYVTRQLELYGPPKKVHPFRQLIGGVMGLFRDRLKQPLIALMGLSLGFGGLYWGFNLLHDGPIRQQTLEWVTQLSLDQPIHQIQELGRRVQRNAENTVLIDNMERTRVMLEAYPVEGGGYPLGVKALHERALQEGYWSLTRNPYTREKGQMGTLRDFTEYNFASNKADFAGIALYQPMGKYDYRIYGCNEKGELLEQDGDVFYLSRP